MQSCTLSALKARCAAERNVAKSKPASALQGRRTSRQACIAHVTRIANPTPQNHPPFRPLCTCLPQYVPHVIEPSVGVDRCFLAVLCSAYAEDIVNGEPRTLLRFHPRVAPIKAGVFPLVKNNEQIMEKAQALHKRLQRRHNVAFDAAGNIGRRYRRMDEAGTPFCVTVDFQTLEDDTVTLRERDSTAQRRVSVDELVAFISDQCE